MQTFELRDYQPAHHLSETTPAFTASLYIDGQWAADVRNDGRGGANRYYFKDRDLERAFHVYCEALPPLPPDDDYPDLGPLAMDADLFIGELCERAEHEAWVAKQIRTHVLFRLKGDAEGEYRTIAVTRARTANNRRRVVAYVRETYGERLEELLGE
jgi:hypothetical protein